MKRKTYQAVCRQCGEKHYSRTTNKKGLILCVKCDPVIKENKEYQ